MLKFAGRDRSTLNLHNKPSKYLELYFTQQLYSLLSNPHYLGVQIDEDAAHLPKKVIFHLAEHLH